MPRYPSFSIGCLSDKEVLGLIRQVPSSLPLVYLWTASPLESDTVSARLIREVIELGIYVSLSCFYPEVIVLGEKTLETFVT